LYYNTNTIKDATKVAADKGLIRKFSLRADDSRLEERCLLIATSFANWLTSKPKDNKKQLPWIFIEEALVRYVTGEHVDNWNVFKRLDSTNGISDIWEIRQTMQPQMRLFGAFIAQDSFICLHPPKMRDELKNKGSKQWKAVISKADEYWHQIFPGFTRYRADHFKHYISRNWTHYDWKNGTPLDHG